MAYISQAEKKVIAEQVKPILRKYGLKGSLSINNHSSLVLKIKSGKLDFIQNFNSRLDNNDRKATSYVDVNVYYIPEHFSDECANCLVELLAALKKPGWSRESDMMTDYHRISYYIDITIGTYDKPYVVNA